MGVVAINQAVAIAIDTCMHRIIATITLLPTVGSDTMQWRLNALCYFPSQEHAAKAHSCIENTYFSVL